MQLASCSRRKRARWASSSSGWAWSSSHCSRENEGQGDGEQDLRGFEWTYLQSLSQLDLRTLKGHTGAVHAVAFSLDGRRLASASDDRDGQGVGYGDRAGNPHPQRAYAAVIGVAFSPDGRRIASASDDRTVKVWDAVTGQETLTLKGHTNGVVSVAFSPDGRRLASAS